MSLTSQTQASVNILCTLCNQPFKAFVTYPVVVGTNPCSLRSIQKSLFILFLELLCLIFVCLGIFYVAVEQSTISNLQLQISSSSIGFCDMAPTRNTELAEVLSLLGESYHRNYFLRWIYTLRMTNFNCFIALVAICVYCNVCLDSSLTRVGMTGISCFLNLFSSPKDKHSI